MIGRVDGPGRDDPRDPREDFHDDLLVTLLHPDGEVLPARPGSFDLIRRGATRRRRLRAALGGGLAVAAAAAVAVPLLLTGGQTVTTVPVSPLAPQGTSVRPTPASGDSRSPGTARPRPVASPTTATRATPVPTALSSDASSQDPRTTRSGAPSQAHRSAAATATASPRSPSAVARSTADR